MSTGKCSKRDESPREKMIREAAEKIRRERQGLRQRSTRPEEDLTWEQTDFRETEDD